MKPRPSYIKAQNAKPRKPTAMNLACKIGLATATLTMACTLPGLSEPEPIRRPTYTPYPTFTPAPAVPTQTPLHSTMAPTVDPNLFQGIGSEELFFGSARTESENGRTLMNNGDYQGAIAAFSRAQVHHGRPSVSLRELDRNSIPKIERSHASHRPLHDSYRNRRSCDTDRTNRATSYLVKREGATSPSTTPTKRWA